MSRISDEMRRDARKSPEELEHEIDATRADLEQTLEALERRLSPEVLLNEALGRVRSYGGEFAQNLGDDIREHPVPMLLASVGIAWLMTAENRRRKDGDGHLSREVRDVGATAARRGRAMADAVKRGEQAARDGMRRGEEAAREGIASSRETISRGIDKVRGGAHSASSAMHEAGDRMHKAGRRVHDAEQRTRDMAGSARRQLRRARHDAQQMLEDQPLLIGALGLAAGAIAGAALPASRQEDEMLGPMRDRAMERAEEAGKDALATARERGKDALEAGRRAASRDGRDGGHNGGGSAEARHGAAVDGDREPGPGGEREPRRSSPERPVADERRAADDLTPGL